jgi:hypothetical protein
MLRACRSRHSATSAAGHNRRQPELHKLAAMTAGVSEALRERGVADPSASILSEVAIAISASLSSAGLRRAASPT